MALIANGVTLTSSGNLDATKLTGNLPALNGASLTNVPGGVSNVNTVVITSSTTYTPTSGTKFFKVYCTGGGGSGASAPNDNVGTTRSGGAGGAGGTAIRTYDATEMGATASVSIGAGGSATSGNKYQSQQGNNGSASSFNPAGTGTTITGNGGQGGRTWMPGNNGTEMMGTCGYGGTASGGQLNLTGGSGMITSNVNLNYDNTSSTSRLSVPAGGVSFWSGATHTSRTSSGTNNGDSGSNGSGGSGGTCKETTGTANGGAGGGGVVVIEEYA